MFLRALEVVSKDMKFPGTLLLRMNAPGHRDCPKHRKPLSSAASSDEIFASYNWPNMSWSIDDVIMSELGKAERGMALNTTMHRLRPDGKHISEGYGGAVDCLHSCLPGPVDWYNRLLLNMMAAGAV